MQPRSTKANKMGHKRKSRKSKWELRLSQKTPTKTLVDDAT